MYNILKYLKHLLSATNQHGVHSPFVYNYLTKCLYTKPKFKGSISENVLLKSIPYFSIEKINITSEDSIIENRIEKEFRLISFKEAPFDCIYLDNYTENIITKFSDKIHNDSMLILENIHRTKERSNSWKVLLQNPKVSVSIDLFHCGLLFFREEQVKEHFKIRI